jgi:hypothetical protein
MLVDRGLRPFYPDEIAGRSGSDPLRVAKIG